MDRKELEKHIRSDFARKGGRAKFEKYGVDHYKEMAKKAVEARKKKRGESNPQEHS